MKQGLKVGLRQLPASLSIAMRATIIMEARSLTPEIDISRRLRNSDIRWNKWPLYLRDPRSVMLRSGTPRRSTTLAASRLFTSSPTSVAYKRVLVSAKSKSDFASNTTNQLFICYLLCYHAFSFVVFAEGSDYIRSFVYPTIFHAAKFTHTAYTRESQNALSWIRRAEYIHNIIIPYLRDNQCLLRSRYHTTYLFISKRGHRSSDLMSQHTR